MKSTFSCLILTTALLVGVMGTSAAQRDDSGLRQRRIVPKGTVVKVVLLDPIRSARANVGDRIRVEVAEDDRSGMPIGAILVARVTFVQESSRSRPGIVDMVFRTAELGDRWIPISGIPFSLDSRDVRQSASGRLVARGRSNNDMKFIGYGAAGGVLLGRVLGTSSLEGALLGSAAGYLYGQTRRDTRKYRNVVVRRDETFGVRLNSRVVLRADDFE